MSQEKNEQANASSHGMSGMIIRTLWGYIGDYPKLMVFSMCLGVIGGVLQLAPHFIVYLIANDVIAGELFAQRLYLLGAICLALVIVGLVTTWGSSHVSHIIAANVQKQLRQKIAAKLTRVPLGFFADYNAHELKTLVVDDVEAIEDGVAHLIPEITAAFTAPAVILAAMFWMDWRMALASILGLVAAFYMMGKSVMTTTETTKKFYASKEKMGAQILEVVQNLPMVKILSRGDATLSGVSDSFAEFRNIIEEWVSSNAGGPSWFMLLSSSALLFVLPVGLLLIYLHMLDLSTLIFFLLFSIGLNNLTVSIYSFTHRIARQASIHIKMEQFYTAEELQLHDVVSPSGRHNVVFRNVSFSYEHTKVLSGVSIEVPQGSSLALVGPSGAGKTTIARLLPRFWDVDEGAIEIGGVDIRHMTPQDLSAQMSFVFQEVFLFSDSIASNIRIGRDDASEDEIIAAAKAAQIHDFIMTLPEGYETVLSSKGNISGGEKQRICIARAILKNAPILVLDEATSFADAKNEAALQQAINQLIKGKTLIVIAHRLSTIRNLDRIAVVVDGQIVERGGHDELLAVEGKYKDMWDAHSRAKNFKIGVQRTEGTS